MLEFNDALSAILSGTEATIKKNGFSVVKPENAQGDLPANVDGEHTYFDFVGEKGKIRLEFFGNQALLFYSDSGADSSDDDLVRASVNYFNPAEFNEKDIKSLCNELNETVESKFGSGDTRSNGKTKKPVPVSKSAAKSGAQAYDGNTLANRLAAIYPELKEPYRENYEKYGEFLAEDFFVNYGAEVVIETIRKNSAQEMKRLFKILNDIYENGSTATQGLIAVTILGNMNNDPKMCAEAAEYMCEDMKEPVLLVNKYLASNSGKKALEKLKNPPPYKPKKEKKPSAFSQMMAGGTPNGGA